MKDSLQPGLTTTRRFEIDEARTIGFMGADGRVYATPGMVADVEITCRDMLLAHADEGEDSVGMRVELDHLGATPLGAWVDIEARVAGVEGRKVTFDIFVQDAVELVGRGRHVRFVVDVARLKDRLAGKRDKLAKH